MRINPSSADLTRRQLLQHAAVGAAAFAIPSVLPPFGSVANSASATRRRGSTASGTGPLTFLNSLDPGQPLTEAFDAQRTEWNNAHPDEPVSFENAPFADFLVAATTRSRAGELEDVVQMLAGQAYSPLFPALMPLERSSFSFADELTGWSGTLRGADAGVQAGVPLGSVGVVWYYNRDLFEQAGLDPDAPPENWDDFATACEALKGSGATPIGMSGLDSYFAWWMWIAFSPQFFSTEADLQAVLAGETKLNDARVLAMLEPVEQSFREGWWNENYADSDSIAVEAMFASGEVAMVSGLTTDLAHWQVWDRDLGVDKYGSMAAPLLADGAGRGLFYNPSQMLGINKDTEVEASARAWCEFLTSKDVQTVFLAEAGQFPNRTDIDIGSVTGSAGAQAVADLVAEYDGGVDCVQNQFNGSATGAAFQNLTAAVTSGDLQGFLDDLQRQQEQ